MKSKSKWNITSIMKTALLIIAISLIVGTLKKELFFFGIGSLVSLIHFYMVFGAIQNNWKVSNYTTRSVFLLLSILSSFWYFDNNFWYFLPGLFLVKGLIIIFVSFDAIFNRMMSR